MVSAVEHVPARSATVQGISVHTLQGICPQGRRSLSVVNVPMIPPPTTGAYLGGRFAFLD